MGGAGELKYKVMDAHTHVGCWEKEGIEERVGMKECWTKWERQMGLSALRKDLVAELGPAASDPAKVPDFTLEHTIKVMNRDGVEKIVLIPMNNSTIPPSTFRWFSPNDHVKRAVDRYPDRFIGLMAVDPLRGTEGCIREMDRCAKLGLVGVKLYPPSGYAINDHELTYPIYRKASELGLIVYIHTGATVLYGCRFAHKGRELSNAIQISEVAQDLPDLKIVMCHFNGSWGFDTGYGVMLVSPNVYGEFDMKIWTARCKWPIRGKLYEEQMAAAMDAFPDRCLIGSDYPMVYPFSLWIRKIEDLDIMSDTEKKKLLETNARSLFKA